MQRAIRYIIHVTKKELEESAGSRAMFAVLLGFLGGFAGILVLHLIGVL